MNRIAKSLLFTLLLVSTHAISQENAAQENFKESVLSVLPQIPGWCSKTKASAMMDLIFKVKPTVCVEIGVFGGASLFPTASALKYVGNGVVYAIDPWDNWECMKCFPEGDPNRTWWQSIDLNGIFGSFVNLLRTQQLEDQCIVLMETSKEAASEIDAIDILHIDGNHCDASALIDVVNYEPKVKVGGYIWFDGWSSAPTAFDYLKETCEIKQVINSGACVLMEKISER